MAKESYVLNEKTTIEEIVMKLNSKAFDYSKTVLFDIFGYRYIGKDDFRAVDLMEQFMCIVEMCEEDIKKYQGVLKYYAVLLEQMYDDYIYTQEESRADRFQNKGLALIAECKTNNASIESIYDATMIFVSLFRETYKEGKLSKSPLENADFTVKIEDVELIKSIFNGIKPNGRRLRITSQMAYKSSPELRNKLFFMFAVVIVAFGLQSKGVL